MIIVHLVVYYSISYIFFCTTSVRVDPRLGGDGLTLGFPDLAKAEGHT